MSKLDKVEQLFKDMKKGNYDKVIEVINNNQVNINIQDKKTGKNLLQQAIEAEEIELVDLLLSKTDININATNIDGSETTLETAVLFENIDIINKLISKGVDLSKINSKGRSAIQTAVVENRAEVLDIFWKKDSELINKTALNLFDLAIEQNSNDVLLLLIKRLPVKLLTKANDDGDNIIHLSVSANKTQLVKQLLNRIANSQDLTVVEKQFALNNQNKKGDTYLHIAYRNEFQTIIGILQNPERKIFLNKDIKNQKGETIDDILKKKQVSKENQQIRQEKLREQKKQRIIEKQDMRKKEIQLAERNKIQEKLAVQRALKEQQELKNKDMRKTRYIGIAVIILVIIITYFALDHVASKPSASKGVL